MLFAAWPVRERYCPAIEIMPNNVVINMLELVSPWRQCALAWPPLRRGRL